MLHKPWGTQDVAHREFARSLNALLLCSGWGLAQAQSADMPLYDGRWLVRLPAGPAAARQAELRLEGFGGTWRYLRSPVAGKDPCKGQRLPVTVQESRPERLELSVWGSAVAAACPDSSLVLEPAPWNPKGQAPASRPPGHEATAEELTGEMNGVPGVSARRQRR